MSKFSKGLVLGACLTAGSTLFSGAANAIAINVDYNLNDGVMGVESYVSQIIGFSNVILQPGETLDVSVNFVNHWGGTQYLELRDIAQNLPNEEFTALAFGNASGVGPDGANAGVSFINWSGDLQQATPIMSNGLSCPSPGQCDMTNLGGDLTDTFLRFEGLLFTIQNANPSGPVQALVPNSVSFSMAFNEGEIGNVPVPATLAIFGLGLAGLGLSRRKKA